MLWKLFENRVKNDTFFGYYCISRMEPIRFCQKNKTALIKLAREMKELKLPPVNEKYAGISFTEVVFNLLFQYTAQIFFMTKNLELRTEKPLTLLSKRVENREQD